MTERLHFHFSLPCIGEGNGNPLQYSCLENPRDGGTCWAAVYGVAQSRTQLKQLSSSSSMALTSACLQVPLPLCETQNTCIPHPGLQCPPTPHASLSVGWCCCWRALCYASTYVCSQPVLLACPPGEDQVWALAEFSTSGDQF